ncbi:MAG: hypothetical protein K2F97_06385 [Muribaculaceae bacterium]|nr:hypothetical protein [Muribaculaceae bacterium]
MDKKALLVVLSLVFSAVVASADSFRVIALSGVELVAGKRTLSPGEEFTDRETVVARWLPAEPGRSRYVQFMNLTARTTCLLAPGDTRRAAAVEPGFWDRVMSYFSDIRRCSTRSGADELLGDLADRLSATFYLLRTDDESNPASRLDIATDLPLDGTDRYIRAIYTDSAGCSRAIILDHTPGLAILRASALPGLPAADASPRTVLRLSLDYVDVPAARPHARAPPPHRLRLAP